MHQLTACPVCQSRTLQDHLSCRDYTVSHETFTLQRCQDCGLILTNPRPEEARLTAYYESENYISHSDRASGLLDQAYRLARRFTLDWKYNLVIRNSTGRPSVLDVGCGTGSFLKKCKDRGLQVTGVEPAANARKTASQLLGQQVFNDLSLVKSPHQAVTLWHVLEHVPDLNQTLSELRNILTQDGALIIAVPNPESFDAQKYQALWAGYDVPRHLWHFTKSTMNRVLQKHELKLEKIIPMKLDAFYVSLLSEKYKTGRNNLYNMAQALLTGWKSNRTARKTSNYSSLIYIIRK